MRTFRNERGQGMTEYIILVALIAVAAIVAVRFFGDKTKEGFETAGQEMQSVSDGMKGAAKQKGGNLGNLPRGR